MLAFYTPKVSITAWFIVLLEIAIATVLVISRSRIIGILLTILFMICLAITVWMTPHYPHDFGGILNDKSEKQLLLFALTGIVLAAIAFWLGLKTTREKNLRSKGTSVIYT